MTPDEQKAVFNHWRNDAESFVRDALDGEPTRQQKEALRLITKLCRDKSEGGEFEKKRGISIMSGQGTGKDCFASWVILWFLTCFPRPKIPCTAPTSDQLKSVLWSEIAKWCKGPIADMFEIQNDRVFMKSLGGKEWFAQARTCKAGGSATEQAETLAGFHEDYMMVVCDEASGLPDPVFQPLEGGLTGQCNFILVIFNPTKNTGFAYDTQYGKFSDQWIKLHWDARESERVSKDHIESMKEKYGENSNRYRIRVLGYPPEDVSEQLIPRSWVINAIESKITLDDTAEVVMGIDCAGMGADKSAIVIRKGPVVTDIFTYDHLNTTELAGWAVQKIHEYSPNAVMIDVIGLGAGVYDQIKPYCKGIRAINVANKAYDDEKYARQREELWFRLRERFENGTIKIPNNEELVEELTSITMLPPDSQGRFKVESKKDLKSRGMASPDCADALCLTLAHHDWREVTWKPIASKKDRWEEEQEHEVRSWLTA